VEVEAGDGAPNLAVVLLFRGTAQGMIALPGGGWIGVTFVMSGHETCDTVGSPFHMVLQYIVRQEKKKGLLQTSSEISSHFYH
jgi:hypothetical protein